MDLQQGIKRILVVDDDPSVLVLLRSLLSKEGYEVIDAKDGLDAMVEVRRQSPDLIILDIMMPEMNGYEVCSLLKFDDKYKEIPIIVLTTREQELDPRISQMMGIDYMHKPLVSDVLLEKIHSALLI